MTNSIKPLIAAGMAAFVVFIVVLGISHAWDNRDGKCIQQSPKRAVSGRIWTSSPGVFSGAVAAYSLGWAGVYEHSGGECLYWRRTTEAEYSRQMYGHDAD